MVSQPVVRIQLMMINTFLCPLSHTKVLTPKLPPHQSIFLFLKIAHMLEELPLLSSQCNQTSTYISYHTILKKIKDY
ncbi:hypothetical protein Scep_011751 [Stephania cephalantha]|uniref:Uncharacterized protein n=1 Tax=Stephania cephalantha TaxID=152367 RepID=A0AAP0JDZ8_9MAGN